MSASGIIETLGKRRIWEGSIEAAVPLLLATSAFGLVVAHLGSPEAGRSLTEIESFAVLALPTALMGWAAGRVALMSGLRRPWKVTLLALFMVGAMLLSIPSLSSAKWSSECSDLGGILRPIASLSRLVDTRADATGDLDSLCQIGGVEGSAFLTGTLLRPRWRGMPQLLPISLPILLLLGAGAALALRDKRLVPTRLPHVAWETLRLSSAAGVKSLFPSDVSFIKESDGRWKACANPTLWGEPCGQLYPKARPFTVGEACGRCGQIFRPAPLIPLTIVTLRHGDLDYLNNLEDGDAESWVQGSPRPVPRDVHTRRWERLGELRLPDVLPLSQALALIRHWLETLPKKDDPRGRAIELALHRASALSAWGWFAESRPSMKSAIPTTDVSLGVGTDRLRELFGGRGGWKGLQLETGLMPVELRFGFYRPPSSQDLQFGEAHGARWNQKQSYWLPVSSVALSDEGGSLWVPRVEGEGLRTWLTLTSRAARFTPAPYFYDTALWKEACFPRDKAHDMDEAPLSLLRLPRPDVEIAGEPVPLGARLIEWDWMDPAHIVALRRQTVIMGLYEPSWNRV